jgi:hypothetical protein
MSPYLATFLLVLPDRLPVGHLSTVTVETDELAPYLEGAEQRILENLPVIRRAPGQPAHNFVSLRFWQVHEEAGQIDELAARTQLATRVLDALMPRGTATVPFDSLAGKWAESESGDMFGTVVEAVTSVPDGGPEGTAVGHEEGDALRDPLQRCIEVLVEYQRAYRVAAHVQQPELTYERLHPFVLWFRREMEDSTPPERPTGIVLLDHQNYGAVFPPLDAEAVERTVQMTSRLRAGDPFALYAERRLEAQIQAATEGLWGNSILQTAIAAEVLLDAVLGLMTWEEHGRGELSLDQAASIFSRDVVPRVRSQYATRLGGRWDLGSGQLHAWDKSIATVRNRVVHAGYRPAQSESSSAMTALANLERFMGDRLSDRWRSYPKTAWLFLGSSGFERRGKLSTAEAWLSGDGGMPVLWAREYQQWRQAVNALVVRRRLSRG